MHGHTDAPNAQLSAVIHFMPLKSHLSNTGCSLNLLLSIKISNAEIKTFMSNMEKNSETIECPKWCYINTVVTWIFGY